MAKADPRQWLNLGEEGWPRLVLAHGAGAPMDSAFMNRMCSALADRRVATARFEFAYMAARRHGRRAGPGKAERLIGEFVEAVSEVARAGDPVFIGGKSMGGRVASMAADRLMDEGLAAGLVCLGYPFHPPGKPDNTRTAHLGALACPTLIVQGERDPFGTRAEVSGYRLSPAIGVHWIAAANHDLKPLKASGVSHGEALAQAATAIAAFMHGR